jgi:hypothetical protein
VTGADIETGAQRAKTDVLVGTEMEDGIDMKNADEKDHNEPASDPYGGRQKSQPGVSEASVQQPMSAKQRELAFSVIRECRAVLAANDTKKPLSAASRADYDKKYLRLIDGLEVQVRHTDLEAWTMRLHKYIDAPSSFRANHAAFCHGLRTSMREGLSEQDRLQREGASEFEWLRQVAHLNSLTKIFAHVQSSTLGSPLWKGKFGKRRRGTSKKDELKVISRQQPNWATIMLEAMRGKKYFDAALVSSLAGPRPEELTERPPYAKDDPYALDGPYPEERRKGVVIERDGPDTFAIVVGGAKVRDVSGQPWRRLVLPRTVLPAAWQVRLEADEFFIISVLTTEAYSAAMSRVSRRVLSGLPVVTPNLFRHAFSDRLRDHGRSAEEIAAAMGHSVAQTQALYGGRAGGGKRRTPDGKAPVSIQAARPVRPLDPSGLDGIIGRGRANKPKRPGD